MLQEQFGYGGSIAGLEMFKFLVRCCVFERQKPLINGRVVFAPNGQRAASRAALRRADVLWKGKARVTVPYLTSTCTRVAVLLGWCTKCRCTTKRCPAAHSTPTGW